MKPLFEKLTGYPDEGFVFKEIRGRSLDCPWHLHPELELILLLEGRGHRIVGDNVASLQPGDMVFVGAHLPHIYQTDPIADQKTYRLGDAASDRAVHCHLIQFETRGRTSLFEMPAFEPVRRLFQKASLGLHVMGKTRDQIEAAMLRMLSLCGVPRIGAFLEILDLLAHSRSCRTIASPGFDKELNPYEQDRVNRVYQFIHENLDQSITLREAASLVHLSEGAFSRFFRARIGKTFPEFVNELRIGRASRLLAETELPITEIALACGYQNLSNFNRQFLRLKQSSPRQFRRRVQPHLAEI
jgi:AraC-like DNA-binding protein